MIDGRVWVHSIDARALAEQHLAGRRRRRRQPRQTRSARRSSSAPRCSSRRTAMRPERRDPRARRRARARPSSSARSTATSSSRMITLAAPCRALMDTEPLTVDRDDLVSDDLRRTSRTSTTGRPSPSTRAGSPSGSSRVRTSSSPQPRRVLLVDHAEQAQSVPGSRRPRSSRSSTTTTSARSRRACRCSATFDPVGSTATLVVERFRQNGMEPSRRDRRRCCSARSSRTR